MQARSWLVAGAAVALSCGVPLLPVAAQRAPQSDEQVEAARAAIARIDAEQMIADPDYARQVLGHLDVLDGATDDPEFQTAIDSVRLTAVTTIGEPEPIRQATDRILAARPTDATSYGVAWWAVMSIPDYPRGLAVVEQASQRVPGVGWAELREALGPEDPWYVFQYFREQDDKVSRARLAAALYRIGWPGGGNLDGTDSLRMMLLQDRLEQGDEAQARDYAASLVTPTSLLPLLLLKRYDALVPPGADRLARLRETVAAYDRQTLDVMGTEPDATRILQRAHFLRSVGRERDAYALLEPHTRDVAATVEADGQGMWLINEAVYALLSLGRSDDAVRLMERLVARPVAENADLIGPYINHSIVLLEAGRPAEALAYATTLERDHSQFANDYGKMWIAASIVCSLAALDRGAEATPTLERLRSGFDDNPGALTRALLCLNDLDGVEAVVIRRLESEDPQSMVLSLQNYAHSPEAVTGLSPLFERLQAVRERPDVRAALERVGRLLDLPLSRIYWGDV